MDSGQVVLTGSGGFLGWHTRAALRENGERVAFVTVGENFNPKDAAEALSGASRVIHLAGVNRGTDQEVSEGNVLFASQLAEAIALAGAAPKEVVFANSVQSGNGSVYGEAKAKAAELLSKASEKAGSEFLDLRLPNLFGEHGRPFYNSVTATFCSQLAEGREPTIEVDRELSLMHAQDAADLLTGRVGPETQASLEVQESVSGLLSRLRNIAVSYRSGEIPDIAVAFERNLFNTYRSYTFLVTNSFGLKRKADERGAFFEILRSQGGAGQHSFSTTLPGVIRGNHFHRRKVERFTVLSGSATISLRKLYSEVVLSLEVTGDKPVAIDMPTMWAHNIVNTGSDVLYTSFWANELFDQDNPDTIPEAV
ncbi:MAG: NAD-dependent epimerase/dehydratase family protein [Cryobacterium sp.]|nr:NAD-dependent epimerase/dehydratase family protein [Cryobacterium sp.]